MHSTGVAAEAASMAERLRALPSPDAGSRDVAVECAALLELVDAAQALLLERVAVLDAAGPSLCGEALTARGWLRREAKCADATAGRLVSLARRLHTDPYRPLPMTADALRSGEVTVEQAAAVADATAAAPAQVVPDIEAALIGHGAHLGASELRRVALGTARRLAEQAGTDIPEDIAQSGGRYLRLRATLGGRIAVDGVLEPDTGRLLAAVLEPLAAPVRVLTADGTLAPDPRTAGQRQHDGLHEALVLLAGTTSLPEHGGTRPMVQVLLDARDGTATTIEGEVISKAALRRHACDAEVSWLALHRTGLRSHSPALAALERELDALPIALGGSPVEVLAAGRSVRLVTAAQRRALNARDRGCTAPGCTAPASRCHAHHIQHWIDGGPTDLDNLVLLCPAHHRHHHENDVEKALAHAPPRAA